MSPLITIAYICNSLEQSSLVIVEFMMKEITYIPVPPPQAINWCVAGSIALMRILVFILFIVSFCHAFAMAVIL